MARRTTRLGRALPGLVCALCIAGTTGASQSSTLPLHSLASTLALPMAQPPALPDLAIPPPSGSTLGDGAEPPQAFLFGRRKPREPKPKRTRPSVTLSAERARILLQSLTVPGWGQLTTGHPTAAKVFGVAELGVWSTYTAFRIQNRMRRDAYIRTANVLAGIDLGGRDEEFQRIVGLYLSSDEYNHLVVMRDAANLYYDDPVAYRQYFEDHKLKGSDVWAWPDDEALLRYRGQRKDSQRAALRANAALGMAIVNRLLSAIHAARLGTTPSPHSWEMKTLPVDGDPTAFRVGVQRRF